MLTQKIDSAIDAIARCRTHLPYLAECFRQDAPERVALEDLLAALRRTEEVLKSA